MKRSRLSQAKKILVLPDGKIAFKDPLISHGDNVVFVQHFDRRRIVSELKKLAKKEPSGYLEELPIEVIPPDPTEQIVYVFDRVIEMSLLLRSVCKTVVNLYVSKGYDRAHCGHAIEFLKEDVDNVCCWPLDPGICKMAHGDSPYHVIIIRGDKKNKILYGYYEVFGVMGFVVLLNGNYAGEPLSLDYTFDPRNGIEVEATYPTFQLRRGDIFDHLVSKPVMGVFKLTNHWL